MMYSENVSSNCMGKTHLTNMGESCRLNTMLYVVILIILCVSSACAQITTPLHIGAITPIVDEFDANLCGDFWNPGDVVQVLWASNGIVYPPAIDGTPHYPVTLHWMVPAGMMETGRYSASFHCYHARFPSSSGWHYSTQ